METIWHLKGQIVFKEVGFILFIIEFKEILDLERIKDGRPWSFDQNLSCLTEYKRNLTSQKLQFVIKPMWVQLHDLPFGMMNNFHGKGIAQQIGEVLDIDVDT